MRYTALFIEKRYDKSSKLNDVTITVFKIHDQFHLEKQL